jgi:hypothetical protein
MVSWFEVNLNFLLDGLFNIDACVQLCWIIMLLCASVDVVAGDILFKNKTQDSLEIQFSFSKTKLYD